MIYLLDVDQTEEEVTTGMHTGFTDDDEEEEDADEEAIDEEEIEEDVE
jgi:hypothetical protein